MNKLKSWASLSIIILLFSLGITRAQALNIPTHARGYVNDYAKMLTANQESMIDNKLRQFDKDTSNQVVVVTLNSLDGNSLEDVSMRIATKWKIGTKQNDNGVLLLIIKNDHKIRIEVGYGLEGSLTDGLSGDIIRYQIAPEFKNGDYYQGIENGIQSIMSATQGQYKPSKHNSDDTIKLWFFCFFLILWLLSSFIRKTGYFIGTPIGSTLAKFSDNSSSGGFFGSSGGFLGGGGCFGGGGASGGW